MPVKSYQNDMFCASARQGSDVKFPWTPEQGFSSQETDLKEWKSCVKNYSFYFYCLFILQKQFCKKSIIDPKRKRNKPKTEK